MPETCEEAVRYVDPANAETYARELEKVLWDREVREEYASRAFERSKFFRWDRTAKQTLELLRLVHAKAIA